MMTALYTTTRRLPTCGHHHHHHHHQQQQQQRQARFQDTYHTYSIFRKCVHISTYSILAHASLNNNRLRYGLPTLLLYFYNHAIIACLTTMANSDEAHASVPQCFRRLSVMLCRHSCVFVAFDEFIRVYE